MIAYFPFFRGSANVSRLLAMATKKKVWGYDFPFLKEKEVKIADSALTAPVIKSLKEGADTLLGHAMGGYAICLASPLIDNKKIFLVDGGYEQPEAALKDFSLADARAMLTSPPGETAPLTEPPEWEAAWRDIYSDIFLNQAYRMSPTNAWHLIRFIASTEWDGHFQELCKNNQVTIIANKKFETPYDVHQILVDWPLHELSEPAIRGLARWL